MAHGIYTRFNYFFEIYAYLIDRVSILSNYTIRLKLNYTTSHLDLENRYQLIFPFVFFFFTNNL